MDGRTIEQIRDDNNIRLRRAEAWIERAQNAADDTDRFIFYWIAFSALFSWEEVSPVFWRPPSAASSGFSSGEGGVKASELHKIKPFIRAICSEDEKGILADAVADKLDAIRTLAQLPYVYKSFWTPLEKEIETMSDWLQHFAEKKENLAWRLNGVVEKRKPTAALLFIFDNLYVIRNQVFHGSHSGGSESHGYTQVEIGAELLDEFIPCFRRVMNNSVAKNPDKNWGGVFFRPQGDPDDPNCPPPWLVKAE